MPARSCPQGTLVIAALTCALALLGAIRAPSSGAATRRPGLCRAGQLVGSFAHVPGSDATGHSLYRLHLRTRRGSCRAGGSLGLRLLGSGGQELPTEVKGRLRPRGPLGTRGVGFDLEISPDMPSEGEPEMGPCEPTAHRLRVSLRSLTFTVDVLPPTPVCGRGFMLLIPRYPG